MTGISENAGVTIKADTIHIKYVTYLPSKPEDDKGYIVEVVRNANKARKTPYMIIGHADYDMRAYLESCSREQLFDLASRSRIGDLQREFRQAVLLDLGFVKLSAAELAAKEALEQKVAKIKGMLDTGVIDQATYDLMVGVLSE